MTSPAAELPPPEPHAERGAAMVRRVILALMYAAVGLTMVAGACLLTWRMATEHNEFPLGYHPDEPEKVVQVRDERQLNFHHPLMLLETGRWIAKYRGLPETPTGFRANDEDLVNCGRTASAAFVTIAVGAIALAGWRVCGLAGLVSAAIGAMCCPQLIIHGHYMKEDAALLCGVGLAVLGITLVWMTRNVVLRWGACAFLGFACGAAISGKLAGIVTLAPAGLAALISWQKARPGAAFSVLRSMFLPGLDRLCRVVLVAGFAAGTFAVINHRAMDWSATWGQYKLSTEAYNALGGEVEHAQDGHFDSALAVPNLFFARTTWMLTPKPLWALLGVCVAGTALAWMTRGWTWMHQEKARRRRGERGTLPVYPSILRRIAVGMTLALFLVVFLIALGHSAIPFRRYAAPAVMLTYVLAGLSVVMFARAVRPTWAAVAVSVVGIGALSAILTPVAKDAVDQFAHDSRTEVRKWVDALPPGTVVYADDYATAFSRRALVNSRRFAVDAGTRYEMGRRGVKYVIICDTAYDRFMDPDAIGDRAFQQRRERYLDLLAQPTVWHGGGEWPSMTFTSPEIRVIELRPPDVVHAPRPPRAPSPPTRK